MKGFENMKFYKKHRKGILIVFIIVISMCFMYEVLHEVATHQRGYEAIGGEFFILFYPLILLSLRDSLKGIKDAMKEDKNCSQCVEYEYCTFRAPDGTAICNEYIERGVNDE